MKRKAAFVSDFDGTITGDDFFAYASAAFFDEKSLTPWRRFKKGEITHFEALKEMFEKSAFPAENLTLLWIKFRLTGVLPRAPESAAKKYACLYLLCRL